MMEKYKDKGLKYPEMGVGAKWAEELRGAGSHKVGLAEVLRVVRVAAEDIGRLGQH